MRIFAVPFTPFHTFPSFPAASSHSLFPSLLFCLLLFVILHSCTFSVSPPFFHYNPAVTRSHVKPAIYNLWGHLWRLKRQNKKQLVVKHFTLVSCQSSCNRNILHIDKMLNFICFSILFIIFFAVESDAAWVHRYTGRATFTQQSFPSDVAHKGDWSNVDYVPGCNLRIVIISLLPDWSATKKTTVSETSEVH